MLYSAKELLETLDAFPSNIIADLGCYLLLGTTSSEDKVLCHLYFDKEFVPILFVCNLKQQQQKDIKRLFVYGFFGNYASNNDYFEMELSIKFNCTGWPIEIVKINSGREKRHGRGTLGLRFLEDYIIPSINSIIMNLIHGSSISYIYGISADLTDDTNALARAKFYCRNGFTLRNGQFYKYLI
ncbi:hypothetical protein [Clostridium thermarum]|uniref:hypothetical protein n=1 Tax=Clostridium thermarum TaxID=1716543 RepID=UPI0013D66D36|nr:hypothetical protein [Clostridium thermarum]